MRLLPVCFIQNDDLVSARGQGHLLLSKHLDLVSDHIYASASPRAEVHQGTSIIQEVKGMCLNVSAFWAPVGMLGRSGYVHTTSIQLCWPIIQNEAQQLAGRALTGRQMR